MAGRVLAWLIAAAAVSLPPSSFVAHVAVDHVNVRGAPSLRAPVIGELERGDDVVVTACVPDCDDPRGWALVAGHGAVARSALTDAPGAPFAPSRASFVYGRVRGGGAVERRRPDADAPIRARWRSGVDLAFRRDDALAARGWLERPAGGFIATAAIRPSTPSDFHGLEAPRLPLVLRDRAVDFVRRRPPSISPSAPWVHVDVSRQLLTAYEGDRLVFATLVSTGRRDRRPTPTGHFHVWYKAIHAPMHNEPGAEPYFVDEVPYAMFFRRGLALHGTFWHDRFGRRMSHGCVNLSLADAAWLFAWSPPALPDGWHSIEPEPAGLPALDVIIEARIAPADRVYGPDQRLADN